MDCTLVLREDCGHELAVSQVPEVKERAAVSRAVLD